MKILSVTLAFVLACAMAAPEPVALQERQLMEMAKEAFKAFIGGLSMDAIRQFNNQAVFIVNNSGKNIDIAVADPGFPTPLVEYFTVCKDKEHKKVYAKKTKLGYFGNEAEVSVKGKPGSYRMAIGSCKAWTGTTFVDCTKAEKDMGVFGVKSMA